jgi:hypothetical protein
VYWVRRLLVLGVVVALVWGVTALLGGKPDDTRQTAAHSDPTTAPPSTPPSTSPTPLPTTPPVASAGDGRPGQQSVADTRPRVVTAALPTADGGCLAEQVTVTPTVEGSPRGGSDVALALSVATSADTACRLELTPDDLLLKVSTGGRPVWSTEQCPGAVPERTLVLRPGWTTAVVVTWPGIYGDKGCTGTTRSAPPGSYAVEAAVYEGEPARSDFDLRPPVRPSGHGPGAGDGPDEGPGGADARDQTGEPDTDDQT